MQRRAGLSLTSVLVTGNTLPKLSRDADKYRVAGTPKRAARKSARRKTKTADPAIQMIVRRGALPRFQALKDKTQHLNVEVVWDRREGDGPEAAAAAAKKALEFADRRGTPPFTWDVADFVVVVPQSSRKKRAKRAK